MVSTPISFLLLLFRVAANDDGCQGDPDDVRCHEDVETTILLQSELQYADEIHSVDDSEADLQNSTHFEAFDVPNASQLGALHAGQPHEIALTKELKVWSSSQPNEMLFSVVIFTPLLLVIIGVHRSYCTTNENRLLALDGLRFLLVSLVFAAGLGDKLTGVACPEILSIIRLRFTWLISSFFLLSGFTSALQLTPLISDPRFSDVKYMVQRCLRIYPTYLLSIALMVAVLPLAVVTEKPYLSVMIAGASAWFKWAAVNPLNTLGWCVGPLLLNACLAPAVLRLLQTSGVKTRWGTLLPFFYFMTFWAAWVLSGKILISIDIINYYVFFIPHVPEFLFGLVLGTCFLDRKCADTPAVPEGLLTELFNATGASFCLAALVYISINFPSLNIHTQAGHSPVISKWGEHGLLLPLLGAFLWQLASPDCYDPLKSVLSSQPLVALGSLSFVGYMFMQFVFAFVTTGVPGYMSENLPSAYFDTHSLWQIAPAAWSLLVVAFAVHHLIDRPFQRVSSWMLLPDTRVLPAAGMQMETKSFKEIPLSWKLTRSALYYAFFWGHVVAIHSLVWLSKGIKDKADLPITLRGTPLEVPYEYMMWFIMIAYMPGMLLNTFGHVFYPAFVHQDLPKESGGPDDKPNFSKAPAMPWKMHFRWVTRGDNPNLVASTIKESQEILKGMDMSPDQYVLEVVTDNPINCKALSGVDMNEILVPTAYKSKTDAKFKARALHYAIDNSGAGKDDWIIHLDEETKMSDRVVAQLWKHCKIENHAVLTGEKRYGNIGQGAILYGTEKHGDISNWVTTMADTGRVGDDFGKFRIQFENGATVIGMHGSFIAISQQVEELVTYDHGHAGSICEDLFFALYAYGHHSVKFSWVDGFMYEQSPFVMMDLIKQRQRWFSGMFLVCFSSAIPKLQRAFLLMCCFSWNLVPMMALITSMMLIIDTSLSAELWMVVSAFNALMMQSYLIGFVVTFSISDGIMRYILLFFMQLNGAPLFGVLEGLGAFRAMTRSEGYMGFHVVQKESGGKTSSGLADEIREVKKIVEEDGNCNNVPCK